jgi:hypothetical protein
MRRDAGRAGSSAEAEMFTMAGDALREAPTPGDLRAALFTVVAGLPGVQVMEGLEDDQGRPAVGLALHRDGGKVRDTLLFDPRTSALLGERRVALRRLEWGTGDSTPPVRYTPGDVISSTTVLDTGVVGRAGARP